MKYLISIMLIAFALNANALDSRTVGSAGFDNLTPQQQAEIISAVTTKAAENSNIGSSAKTAITTAAATNEWLNIGARIGQGFAGAAKELGVAANTFAETPVGKWVAFLIIWHFMGAMAIHVGFGLLFLALGISILYWYSRATREIAVTYDPEKTDMFGRSRLVKVQRGEMPGEVQAITVIGTLILFGASAAIVFGGW